MMKKFLRDLSGTYLKTDKEGSGDDNVLACFIPMSIIYHLMALPAPYPCLS
jgi:hypothetical protein